MEYEISEASSWPSAPNTVDFMPLGCPGSDSFILRMTSCVRSNSMVLLPASSSVPELSSPAIMSSTCSGPIVAGSCPASPRITAVSEWIPTPAAPREPDSATLARVVAEAVSVSSPLMNRAAARMVPTVGDDYGPNAMENMSSTLNAMYYTSRCENSSIASSNQLTT